MPRTYSVFGSDDRQCYLAALLDQLGFPVIHSRSTVRFAEVTVLPIPSITKDGNIAGTDLLFTDFLQFVPASTVLWGTGFAPHISLAENTGVMLKDFTRFPTFAEGNAIPTAEGALQLAMEHLPTTIRNGRFLVIGYGRIGKELTAMLSALGAAVTVARRDGLADDFRTDQTGSYRFGLYEYDAIFNTVPEPVFSEEHCLQTRKDCLLIDLASLPGGIAKTTERNLLHALGLPAKVAPKTAAKIMLSVLLNEMEGNEWNMLQ